MKKLSLSIVLAVSVMGFAACAPSHKDSMSKSSEDSAINTTGDGTSQQTQQQANTPIDEKAEIEKALSPESKGLFAVINKQNITLDRMMADVKEGDIQLTFRSISDQTDPNEVCPTDLAKSNGVLVRLPTSQVGKYTHVASEEAKSLVHVRFQTKGKAGYELAENAEVEITEITDKEVVGVIQVKRPALNIVSGKFHATICTEATKPEEK